MNPRHAQHSQSGRTERRVVVAACLMLLVKQKSGACVERKSRFFFDKAMAGYKLAAKSTRLAHSESGKRASKSFQPAMSKSWLSDAL